MWLALYVRLKQNRNGELTALPGRAQSDGLDAKRDVFEDHPGPEDRCCTVLGPLKPAPSSTCELLALERVDEVIRAVGNKVPSVSERTQVLEALTEAHMEWIIRATGWLAETAHGADGCFAGHVQTEYTPPEVALRPIELIEPRSQLKGRPRMQPAGYTINLHDCSASSANCRESTVNMKCSGYGSGSHR